MKKYNNTNTENNTKAYSIETLRRKKSFVLSLKRIKNLKILKYHILCDKTLLFSTIYNKCGSEDEKIFKKEESI